jgi:hypothetical protein
MTDELAQYIHQRTEGNPLFMVNMVDYVMAQDVPVRWWSLGTRKQG